MRCFRLGLCSLALVTSAVADDVSERFGKHLESAELAEARRWLEGELVDGKRIDDKLIDGGEIEQVRFALGITKVLAAVETLGQDQFRYGALSGSVRTLPILRIPVPKNPQPEAVSYDDVRKIFERFQAAVAEAERELAAVDTSQNVKLRIDVSNVMLDLDGNGEIGPRENFLAVLGAVNRPRGPQPDSMSVAFDAGDVPWLRGYCHFLMAFSDMVLAYDHQRLFNHCAQLVYPKPQPSEDFVVPLESSGTGGGFNSILDFVAAIHLCVFPVREPARMESARQHFLKMIETSRESWTLILAETDDDEEWLPNPKQTGVLPMPVNQKLIDGWLDVLDEIEDVLQGEKLIPFWRNYNPSLFGNMRNVPDEGFGLNMKRICQEPRDFDLVLTIQGTAVLPFVEQGPLSTPETWRELRDVFRGNFFGFAVWFN